VVILRIVVAEKTGEETREGSPSFEGRKRGGGPNFSLAASINFDVSGEIRGSIFFFWLMIYVYKRDNAPPTSLREGGGALASEGGRRRMGMMGMRCVGVWGVWGVWGVCGVWPPSPGSSTVGGRCALSTGILNRPVEGVLWIIFPLGVRVTVKLDSGLRDISPDRESRAEFVDDVDIDPDPDRTREPLFDSGVEDDEGRTPRPSSVGGAEECEGVGAGILMKEEERRWEMEGEEGADEGGVEGGVEGVGEEEVGGTARGGRGGMERGGGFCPGVGEGEGEGEAGGVEEMEADGVGVGASEVEGAEEGEETDFCNGWVEFTFARGRGAEASLEIW
jgi:hypothetical protein